MFYHNNKVNTHSETIIFCFSANNDETHSFRFCIKKEDKKTQTVEKLVCHRKSQK